ncbi:hypothetical protein MASR2M78_37510 [Treponema sp.]
MFALERFRIIKSFLAEKGQVEVHALKELLHVSEVTIRRDLEKLEENGFLVRTHGGAVLLEKPERSIEAPAALKQGRESAQEIGQLASHLVHDGESLLILGSPLTRACAVALSEHRDLTVLTNDLEVARQVAQQNANRVVLIGGDLESDELAVYGTLAQDDLQRFSVDKMFVEPDGIGADFELSASTQQKAALIRSGRERSREFIILAPAERFFRNAFFRFGSLRQGDTLISDHTLNDEAKQRIFTANLRLFTSIDIFEGKV